MSTPLFDHVCDEALYSRLYRQHAQELHDFVYYKYGEAVNPEDKVHEAFMKLWQNCAKVPPDKARSYLFTIVNNLTLNELKHQQVRYRFQQLPQKSNTQITPEHVLEEKQYQEKFENALAKLSEGQRVAFLLNRVEGKRHKEIAELLQISRKAVEKRIYTALDKLREELGEI